MNTGGPAFPVPDSHHANGQVQYGSNGMTLLDWMAGQALAGLCASPETQMPFDVMHRLAYGHAEAMLDEKARRESDHSGEATKMVQGPTAADNERWARFQDGIRIAFSPTGGWLAEIREGSMSYGDTIADAVANLRARWRERNAVPETVDHSPDAGKVAKLQSILMDWQGRAKVAEIDLRQSEESVENLKAMNRELVEALESAMEHVPMTLQGEARAAIAKAKGIA